MKLYTLEIICMALITITEGTVDEITTDLSQESVLRGSVLEEDRKDIPETESENNKFVDYQEDNIEKIDQLLFTNKEMDLEYKKKYIHPRGNRKYLADNYGEEHSDLSDDNLDGEETDVYGQVDNTSNKYLDSSPLSNIISEDDTGNCTKELGTSTHNKENMNTKNDISHQKQTLVNGIEKNSDGISGDEFENDIDKDDPYISQEIESFWDAVDTFINMNSYSENAEQEGSEDPEDLYDYLYTPSGKSPGLDHFLDFLHFVKDVGDAVERIEKDIKWTSEKYPEISHLDLSNNEVDKMTAKKEDNPMAHEGSKINKNAENKSSPDRSKRSNKESDLEIKKYQPKMDPYEHKPFRTSLGLKFPLFQFDLLFSRLIFEPFIEPYPNDE